MHQMILNLLSRLRQIAPGLLTVFVIALAAGFIADHHGGPTLLYALLLGMAMNHLMAVERYSAGVQFAAATVLRLGVALLGLRITVEQILALGPRPLVLVLLGVPLTIGCGLLVARWLGLHRQFGAITGVAVAICGASAAMAMASVLPKRQDSESMLIFTVIGVTSLSTLAMILYPPITNGLALDNISAGIFLGGTIHDVAQVVGAGYLLGEEAGDTATFTKLLRVAMLVPVILVMTLLFRRENTAAAAGAADDASTAPTNKRSLPPLPAFLFAFIALVVINSLGWVPAQPQALLVDFSRWCLITAIAAVGVKANLQELAKLGWKPLLMLVMETLLLATYALVLLHFYH